MFFFKHLNKLARTLSSPQISSSRYQLIKAEALMEYGHFDEALIEAKKARDDKFANPIDVELAKGKIVQVLNKRNTLKPG